MKYASYQASLKTMRAETVGSLEIDEPFLQQMNLNRILIQAMRDPDNWVVRLRYKDSKGKTTIRVVSPIRLEGDSIMALCLAREQCRRLILKNISNVELIRAADVLMPVPIIEVQ